MKQLSAQSLRTTMNDRDDKDILSDELQQLDQELGHLLGQNIDPSFILQTAVFNAISLGVSSLYVDPLLLQHI